MTVLWIGVGLLLLGCSASKATGPTQNCVVTFSQTGGDDSSTSAASGANIGATEQNCGPQDSPNRPKTITTETNAQARLLR